MKKALITGITGQDGSYLSELLLDKDYEVHGIIRRSSSFNTGRIDHLYNNPDIYNKKLFLHYGDLCDGSNLNRLVEKVQPDEIYNLGAMSHVGVSFELPEFTLETDGMGTLRLLDAIRESGIKTKFYQASSSEMFGGLPKTAPQNESTPFYPKSPYGVAKLYAYWITVNYRESYGIHASNGILFNHESILKNSPIIIKDLQGNIDVLPIEDIFKSENHRHEGLLNEYKGYSVWNGEDWTKILNGTSYKNQKKLTKLIQTRQSCYEATYDHIAFNELNKEIKTSDLQVGDKLYKINYPCFKNSMDNDENLAYFIGFVVGDGYISDDGKICITGVNREELWKVANLVSNMFGWNCHEYNNGVGQFENCKNDIWKININNDAEFGKWVRKHIYTLRSNEKRIPKFILNANNNVKKSFFDGYYLADGRKAGHEKYEYKGFCTNSATLCLGLNLIISEILKQEIKCICEYRDGRRYYRVQLRKGNKLNNLGNHLKKDLNEIIKIIDTNSEDGWFFDIQTESQTFATGANLVKIHNSPRRGETFVTRKITQAFANIYKGKQDKLTLGNLDAKRDWGFAGDYVEAMWLMLQQDKPSDYVIASGETHTVREFVELVFKQIDINITWNGNGINEKGYDNLTGKLLVDIDSKYIRPCEVEILQGDASKAKKELGWIPKTSFQELVKMMVQYDLQNVR